MLNNYIKKLKMDGKSECTITAYVSDIKSALMLINKPLDEIKYMDAIEWREKINSLAPNSINRKITALNGYFKFLVDCEIIINNPFSKLANAPTRNIREREYIPMSDANKLIKAAKTSRDKAIIVVGLTTGLRVNEIINLNLSDFLNGEAMVITKGGKLRHIVFNKTTKKYVNEYLCKRVDGSGYLFTTKNGNKMDEHYINPMLKKAAKEAGFKDTITPHQLRHTHISYMVDNYGISAAQHEIGHSSIAITQRYAHNTDKELVSMSQNITF